jgi:hypothetical protein
MYLPWDLREVEGWSTLELGVVVPLVRWVAKVVADAG